MSLLTRTGTAGALLCALLAWTPPAHAIIFDDEALEQRLNQLEERIARLEATMQQLASKLNQASAKDQELIDLIRAFQGNIEELGHQISQQQEDNQGLIRDIDGALRAEIADLAARLDTLDTAIQTASMLPEDQLYEMGYASHQAGDHEEAIRVFSQLTQHYPDGEFAGNAHYWIGLSHLALEDHAAAVATLKDFVESRPNSSRAPEAMLHLADAYAAQGDKEAGRKTLEVLIKFYPSSLAADSARQRIKTL